MPVVVVVVVVDLLHQYSPMVPRTTAITSINKHRIPKVTAMGRQRGDVAQVTRKPEGTEIKMKKYDKSQSTSVIQFIKIWKILK